jgi:hypothetical protein
LVFKSTTKWTTQIKTGHRTPDTGHRSGEEVAKKTPINSSDDDDEEHKEGKEEKKDKEQKKQQQIEDSEPTPPPMGVAAMDDLESTDDDGGDDGDDEEDEEDEDNRRRKAEMSSGKAAAAERLKKKKRKESKGGGSESSDQIGGGWKRIYANVATCGPTRTLPEHRKRAMKWLNAKTKTEQETLARLHGVKYSVLLQLDYWDPTRFLVIDSLHAFWLGVCKSYMKQLRDMHWKPNSKELKIMQARLDSMRVPADVCRVLNKWSANMSGLTGQQIKAFVSCFSVAVFDGFLDQKEMALWRLLVSTSRLLSQTFITSMQITQVNFSFCFRVRCPVSISIFGVRICVHLLIQSIVLFFVGTLCLLVT